MAGANADNFKMRTTGVLLATLVAVIAVFARAFYPRIDVNRERELVSSKVCAPTSLSEERHALEDLRSAVSVDSSSNQLRAWKRYSGQWSVRPVIFVAIDGPGTSNCKVEGHYEAAK